MYNSSVDFSADVYVSRLPNHLADCLRHVDAKKVEIEGHLVSFTGGVFRFVGNWNVLVAFGFGELAVDSDDRLVRYSLSFRQLILVAGVLVALFVGHDIYCWHDSFSWQLPIFYVGIWATLVGGNLAIGFPRFDKFLRRAVETAPRLG